MKYLTLVAASLAGASALAYHAGAVAAAADADAAGGETLAEVVVTGSRIITNGNNSPTPVTVVDAQQMLSVNPGTISDALNILPVFSGSNGSVSNPNAGIGAGGGGNGARSSLNLRNLGEARTLVLLDGHRVPTTTSTNVVDADMIPQMMLKRVDVVTGGLSAVYGSDAITGVINFVTDRGFNGVKVNAQTGVSAREDDRQYQVGAAWGMPLGSRAHVEASYEYHNDEGIPYRSTRPQVWLCGMPGNGGAIPYFMSCGLRRYDVTFGGLIKTNAGTLNNQQFVAPGVLAPFNAGQALAVTGSTNVAIGGDGAWLDASLKASLRSHQLFGRMDYDFTDAVHGYVEVAANKKKNSFFSGWFSINGNTGTLNRENVFLSAAQRAQIPTTPGTFTFGKFINTTDTRLNSIVDETQYFAMAGLEGKLGNYDWTVGLVHGDAKLENTNANNTNNFRLSAALDAVPDAAGNPVCRVSLTPATAALFPGCVPMNVFGPGSESPAALAYVKGSTMYVARTKQDEISGSFSGKPFDTWAGPFAAALSAEWRKQKFSSVSGMPPADLNVATNCAAMGLRMNCLPTTSEWGNTFANRPEVSQTVKEAALEFEAPLLSGVTLARELNLNGAVRYTNYDTSGSSNTWKVGLDWHLTDSWRFRATKSRDIRAPTLNDLFAPPVGTGQNITDLLLVGVAGANANSTAPRFESGNAGLKAEVGHTATAGIVWQPQSVPGFSVSVDGYNIEITDAILAFNGTDQSIQTACYNSGGTSFWCSLQTRALGNFSKVPANVVVSWATRPFNIANIHTWGGDLELNYSSRIGTHPVAVRGMLTWQPHIKYVRPFLSTLDQGGAAYGAGGLQASPSTRATLLLRYGFTDRLSVDWQTRYRNSMAMINDPSLATNNVPIPGATFTNLNVNYRLPLSIGADGKVDFFANISNLFNAVPPPANFYGTLGNVGQFGGFPIGDDPIGRYFTAGVRLQF